MDRRGFIGAILAAGVAPYVVRSGILMPVRSIIVPEYRPLLTIERITQEALSLLGNQLNGMQMDAIIYGGAWEKYTVIGDTLKIRRYSQRRA